MLRIQEKNELIVKTQWTNFSCGKIIDYDLRHASAKEVRWKSFRLNLAYLHLNSISTPLLTSKLEISRKIRRNLFFILLRTKKIQLCKNKHHRSNPLACKIKLFTQTTRHLKPKRSYSTSMFGIPEEIQLVIFHRGWNHTSDKMLRHEEGCV